MPTIVPRSEHTISRADISEGALKVLYRLKSAGYEAYLVGGGVRDLLLGREPKDFDVATDARPEEVKRLFRNCRLIGRRFVLAHVQFGRDIVEVATFRGKHDVESGDRVVANGMIVRDNVFGTLEDDAWRRDFTANALYYNIRDFTVLDYTGGLEDLKAGVLRMIGDPVQRYQEDPVRMLRAVRFAAKLGFRLAPDTERALYDFGHLLQAVSPARLFDEVLKLFLGGCAVQTFELMRHYRLFGQLFPLTESSLARQTEEFPRLVVPRGLANTDERIAAAKPVTPAFLCAVLLWDPMHELAEKMRDEGIPWHQALQVAGHEAVARQSQHVAFPKRFTLQAREIWALQARLEQPKAKRALALLEHPRFRAAYDFLLLRAEAGEDLQAACEAWTRLQSASGEERQDVVEGMEGESAPSRRRRRSRSRRPRAASSEGPGTEIG